MRIILAGIEHQFPDEPTPRAIDAVIREHCGRVPIGRLAVSGIQPEDLLEIYNTEGWMPGMGSRYHDKVPMPSVQCFEGLVERTQPGRERLVGPYILGGRIMPNGLATWILR